MVYQVLNWYIISIFFLIFASGEYIFHSFFQIFVSRDSRSFGTYKNIENRKLCAITLETYKNWNFLSKNLVILIHFVAWKVSIKRKTERTKQKSSNDCVWRKGVSVWRQRERKRRKQTKRAAGDAFVRGKEIQIDCLNVNKSVKSNRIHK